MNGKKALNILWVIYFSIGYLWLITIISYLHWTTDEITYSFSKACSLILGYFLYCGLFLIILTLGNRIRELESELKRVKTEE